jgi:uncharacterized protein (UPF0371 family)
MMEKQMIFNSAKYIELQSKKILERMGKFKKLYLEFGGKLFDDFHMSRCVPGFEPDTKIKMLLALKDKCEIIICIDAGDIESGKMRRDIGLTYENEVLRLVDNFREVGLSVNSVVVNKFNGQPAAVNYVRKLNQRGIKNYIFKKIEGYPANVERIVSEAGYGANEFVKTTKPLVVVTAPGASSGKLAVVLSQLYNEFKHGNTKAGFAKFETLPIWNFRLRHPINLAYEASTVNINDVNMIDSYHYEKYGEVAVNYNRDIEAFPIIRSILHKIYKKDVYYSPTDMGVNMIGFCIEDEEALEVACRQEILRRYYQTLCEAKLGAMDDEAIKRITYLVEQLNIKETERAVVIAARKKQQETSKVSVSIQLKNGEIITASANGMTSASSEALLFTLQKLLKVDDKIKLIPENIMNQTIKLKSEVLGDRKFHIRIGEILVILSASAVSNELSSHALSMLKQLAGAEAHATYIISEEEQAVFRKLKINLTMDAVFG